MKNFVHLLLLALVALLAFDRCSAVAESDVAVVVNQKNPITNLSSTEVRKLFTGERRSWAEVSP
jgi:hypothetical protein